MAIGPMSGPGLYAPSWWTLRLGVPLEEQGFWLQPNGVEMPAIGGDSPVGDAPERQEAMGS